MNSTISVALYFFVDGILLTPNGRKACAMNYGCDLGGATELDFFVIGDIGGLPVYPYYSYAQNQVAKSMEKFAYKENLTFVVNLGDNFYFNGVKDIFDSRFEDSFEDIYPYQSLSVPWYTIAGNHDHLGNITAQLDHTNYSSKWTYPSLYYNLKFKFGVGRTTTVEILMIDTVVLCGKTIDVQGEGLFDWLFSKKRDPKEPEPEYREEAEREWQWIEETLQKSTADFLFVAGHYPIHSTCEHGSFECLVKKLDPLIRKYNVNAYFSGHDHNLQHIRLPKIDENSGAETIMNYVISGAASRTDRSSKHLGDVPPNSLLYR